MDILITPRLTLRPLLEVDADDIRELIASEPILAAKLPRAMIALIGSDDPGFENAAATQPILVVIREKFIGWICQHEPEAIAFARRSEALRNEAMAAASQYFALQSAVTRVEPARHQQSSQFAA